MSVLSDILSSKVRAEFFRILFGIGPQEFHLREIQRKSGLAIGTVSQEAANLERLGLIRKRRNGNRTYFSAIKDHPLYNIIHNLVLKTSGLTEILKQPLSVSAIKIAFVFGSIAAGEEKADSDVDLFVIGTISLRALSKLLKGTSQEIGREINPQVMTPDEFIKRKIKKEHFVSSVLESPKLMIKGFEDDLAKLGEQWLAPHP